MSEEEGRMIYDDDSAVEQAGKMIRLVNWDRHYSGPPNAYTGGIANCLGDSRQGKYDPVNIAAERRARRIVALWNACLDIPTEALEAGAVRDLVAVVEELLESAAYWSEYDVPLGIVDRMRTAHDKAKGEG